jgi:ABC-type bacteriocin/lantibiotic exporter with double-glycine peptidase domain
VTFKYSDAENELIIDFSFEVEKGKVLALVGKSGYAIIRKELESRLY